MRAVGELTDLPASAGASSAQPAMGRRLHAVRIGRRSAVLMALVSVAALAMFCWPLLIRPSAENDQHSVDAPLIFLGLLPLLIVLVLAQISDGALDSKAIAMLGVLSAVNAALRPLGGGTGGVETVFFLLILAGRVFGPGFGFVLGCTSLFASALLTAGVGPWLPFQMITSAWVGAGAGFLPDRIGRRQIRGAAEIAMLVGFGVLSALLFGALMNLWFWPFLTGASMGELSPLAFDPNGTLTENLARFGRFTLLTSTTTWDTGRALTNAAALIALGPAVLAVLRRAARRASFSPAIHFRPESPG